MHFIKIINVYQIGYISIPIKCEDGYIANP